MPIKIYSKVKVAAAHLGITADLKADFHCGKFAIIKPFDFNGFMSTSSFN